MLTGVVHEVEEDRGHEVDERDAEALDGPAEAVRVVFGDDGDLHAVQVGVVEGLDCAWMVKED